ncbi:hypothetical protein ABZP36_032152, partial [Zizania latifolia]
HPPPNHTTGSLPVTSARKEHGSLTSSLLLQIFSRFSSLLWQDQSSSSSRRWRRKLGSNKYLVIPASLNVMQMMNVLSSSINAQICQRAAAAAGRYHLCCKGQLQVVAMRSSSKGSKRRRRASSVVAVGAMSEGGESSSGKDDDEPQQEEEMSSCRDRESLERVVGRPEDAAFSGAELAELIRSKYGRSYDVTLIKKEFMGRSLLAMNVMWKYREQRSFPLTEEEYLLRLDDVAASLRCWGAVAHVRSTLAKLKDRPRIGKAVSIFINMDDTGARANEWIYK